MLIVRITGLLCAAFLTMGSGGIAQPPEEEVPTKTLEPEYVDEEPAAEAAAAAEESGPSVTAAPSEETAGAPIPATPEEMAAGEEGAALEVALSDDYIQGRYYTAGGILGFDNTISHVGAYFSDNRDIIGNIGIMTQRVPLFLPGLTLSAGARGYVALLSDPDDDVVGVAPGIEGRFGLPSEIGFPIAAVGSLFYSPDILTLGDAENIIEIDARVEAEIIPDIVGFIGIREFRFDSDEGSDKKAAEEIQVGARFSL